jgi:hypothetical protein
MTKALRWRVLVLQAGLIVILGALAGFTLWASNYVQSSVRTQLTAQAITFPAANSPEITALPAVDQAAMRQYAGQLLTTGPQAEVWADNFMKVHLSAMPTYDAAATIARANPTNAADQAVWETVFMGTTDRSMLLNAYGWWTLGTYTGFAGIGLAIAAFAVLCTFVFELAAWRLQARVPERATVPAPALGGAGTIPAGTVPEYGIARMTRHDG